MTDHTTKGYKIGQRIRYRYLMGAISCCHNGRVIKGEGTIIRRQPWRGENAYVVTDGVGGGALLLAKDIQGKR